METAPDILQQEAHRQRGKNREHQLAIEGGTRIRIKPWPTYDKGIVALSQSDEEAALRALRSRRLFRYDDRLYKDTEVGKFEMELSKFFCGFHAVACSSGTTALALALLASGLKPGDEVICPAFTFAATPSAIILAGGIPVVAEVDEYLNLDPVDTSARITPNVKAIVVVHMRGFSCNIEEICKLAKRHGIPVVEDAVPALGVKHHGRPLGTFGVAAAFSTQADKTINTGEGGFLITSDPEIHRRAVVLSGAYELRAQRHLGKAFETGFDLTLPIFSFRMDEIRAAIARSQLLSLPDRVSRHRENYDYVADAIVPNSLFNIRQPGTPGMYLGESLILSFPTTPLGAIAWFAKALRAEGIDCRHFGDPDDVNIRCFWNWRFMFPNCDVETILGQYPKSSDYIRRSIDIPLSATCTATDCDDLVAALAKVSANIGGDD